MTNNPPPEPSELRREAEAIVDAWLEDDTTTPHNDGKYYPDTQEGIEEYQRDTLIQGVMLGSAAMARRCLEVFDECFTPMPVDPLRLANQWGEYQRRLKQLTSGEGK